MTKMNGQVGISPEYVKDWSKTEAIREIIQNYLDSRDEFECDGYISWEDGWATVKDYGPGLEMRHLVMGISEKADNSRGQFGEGLKLAMLVFAREHKDIEIWAKGKKIKPVISYNETYETDMISLEIEELPPHFAATHTGTSIKFECTENELEAGKAYFIKYFKRDNEYFKWVDKDFVSFPGGNIWINNSRVGRIDDAKFSYHLTGKEAREAINRDRGSIDTEKLAEIIRDKFSSTRSLNTMRHLITWVKDEESCWETDSIELYGSWIDSNNNNLWKRAITEVFGDDLVLASDSADANKQAEYNGARLVNIRSWRWNDLFKEMGVPTAKQVLAKKTKTRRIAQKDLESSELNILGEAKKLVEKHYNKCGRVIIVDHFIGESNTLGMYKRSSDEIFIKRSQLIDLRTTLESLLHECCHKHSGASDCTSEFEKALCDIAVQMMLK